MSLQLARRLGLPEASAFDVQDPSLYLAEDVEMTVSMLKRCKSNRRCLGALLHREDVEPNFRNSVVVGSARHKCLSRYQFFPGSELVSPAREYVRGHP